MAAETTNEVKIESEPGSRPGVRVLRVTGPLTIRNFFEFQDTSRKDTSPILIIDLAGVPYMDSAALGSLLGVHVSCEKAGRKYALVNVCDRLQKMFEISGVQEVLVTYPTQPEAEAALV